MSLFIWVHYQAFKLKVYNSREQTRTPQLTKKQSAIGTLQYILAHFFDTQEIDFEGPRRRSYPTPSFTVQETNNSLDIGITSGQTFDS
ncbi:hypothetical protein N7517_008055 [Penicillium concentricum]|uniref:Uncharacterized protein n=1 Tax=Penicillium concentricum TaxID=293559 RepID=A0A9W9V2D1_9EURO|nr:uncharacterized protein N7517_008055 [Penicillium concentricum]KAJ5365169.1 hypothetical protein N7517_008055 [Penicillium concentricum]